MWHMMILMAMLSSIGLYSTFDQENVAVSQQSQSATLATDMGIYRQAVIDFLQATPAYSGASVPAEILQPFFPTWYSQGMLRNLLAKYDNYITPNPNGVIYIFQAIDPTGNGNSVAGNIVLALEKLSQNSILVGQYSSGDTTLKSHLYGDTQISLASAQIPNGSAVWVAARN